MSGPPKGFNHFHPLYPPDHVPGHVGAPNYRGSGVNRRDRGGMYFNDMRNMPVPMYDVDFDGRSNSRLSNSDGTIARGNFVMPPDHQIHLEGAKIQSR